MFMPRAVHTQFMKGAFIKATVGHYLSFTVLVNIITHLSNHDCYVIISVIIQQSCILRQCVCISVCLLKSIMYECCTVYGCYYVFPFIQKVSPSLHPTNVQL